MATLGLMSAASPGGLGVGAPLAPVQQGARTGSPKSLRYAGGKPNNTSFVNSYPNGPGWGHAKVKRMAKKRRNVLRNRKNHRN
jgi:hypothetical protein